MKMKCLLMVLGDLFSGMSPIEWAISWIFVFKTLQISALKSELGRYHYHTHPPVREQIQQKKLVKLIWLFFRVTMSNNAKGLNSKQPLQAAIMVGDYEPLFDQIWRPLFITRFKHVNDWTYAVYCCLSCNTIFRYELNLFEWKYVTSCKTDHNAIHCYIYTVLLLNLYIILII